jgi:hypothetical protein
MTLFRPNIPRGFVIDQDRKEFVVEPPGNTKTVDEVLQEKGS